LKFYLPDTWARRSNIPKARKKPMLKLKSLMLISAAGLFALGCEKTPEDRAADNIRESTQNQAEQIRNESQNAAEATRDAGEATEARSESKADAIEQSGENTADAVEAEGERKADAVEETKP
jgi:hypothetical protein